jgi:hypothetical protein
MNYAGADNLSVFALAESRPFGERVAAALGVPLAPHEEREFEDGEHKNRPLNYGARYGTTVRAGHSAHAQRRLYRRFNGGIKKLIKSDTCKTIKDILVLRCITLRQRKIVACALAPMLRIVERGIGDVPHRDFCAQTRAEYFVKRN